MGRGAAASLDVSAHHGPTRCSAASYEQVCQRVGVMVNAPTLDAEKRPLVTQRAQRVGAVPIRGEGARDASLVCYALTGCVTLATCQSRPFVVRKVLSHGLAAEHAMSRAL